MPKLITQLIISSLLAVFAIIASATTINVVGTLINQPSQFDFPATFPFADQITGSFTFIDPLPGDYDGPNDNFPGANVSQFDNIASFSLNLDTFGPPVCGVERSAHSKRNPESRTVTKALNSDH